jgi:pimeloyl-ACP methyl ester carboxylesterase
MDRLTKSTLAALMTLSLSGCTGTLRESDLVKGTPHEEAVSDTLEQRTLDVATPDGEHLRGLAWVSPEQDRTLLLFLGNAGTVLDYAGAGLGLAHRTGANVVMVDYRGYGASSGKPSLTALMADGLTVYDHVIARVGGEVVVVGFSLGAAVATRVASKREVRGLALLAPVSSVDDLAVALSDAVPWPQRWFVSLEASPERQALSPQPIDAIGEVRAPILFAFGTDDPIAPPWMTDRLLERARGVTAQRCEVDTDEHSELSPDHDGGQSCVVRFIESLRGDPSPAVVARAVYAARGSAGGGSVLSSFATSSVSGIMWSTGCSPWPGSSPNAPLDASAFARGPSSTRKRSR